MDAEYVVAKAIRDGVIDATIDHTGGFVHSSEGNDIYSTAAPTQAFHDRISFCLEVRNEAVKSMSYAPDAHKKELEEAGAKVELKGKA